MLDSLQVSVCSEIRTWAELFFNFLNSNGAAWVNTASAMSADRQGPYRPVFKKMPASWSVRVRIPPRGRCSVYPHL